MRDRVLEHLGYEWWMFRCAHDLLSRLPDEGDGDPIRNALVESMALHGRNLANFYHSPKRPQKDDWNVEDLGLDLTPMPEKLRAWCAEVLTTTSHITQATIDAIDGVAPGEIRPHLHGRIEAVRNHVGKSMPERWIGHRGTDSAHVRADRWGAEALSATVDAIPLSSSTYTDDPLPTDFTPTTKGAARR